MIRFSSLASGSRANATYLSDGETHLLVDCGLSARETTERLAAIGVSPESIEAIIVTHEHSDHVAGIPIFAKKYGCRVYSNRPTRKGADFDRRLKSELLEEFETGERFHVGGIAFDPFSVVHDAADPVGFRISASGVALAFVTDLGQVTTLVRERVKGVNALVLEFNHDPILLQEAPYPWELKQRISSRTGHLSNECAAELVTHLSETCEMPLQVIVAAHVSEKSNEPKRVEQAFTEGWRRGGRDYEPRFYIASQRTTLPLISLEQHIPDGEQITINF